MRTSRSCIHLAEHVIAPASNLQDLRDIMFWQILRGEEVISVSAELTQIVAVTAVSMSDSPAAFEYSAKTINNPFVPIADSEIRVESKKLFKRSILQPNKIITVEYGSIVYVCVGTSVTSSASVDAMAALNRRLKLSPGRLLVQVRGVGDVEREPVLFSLLFTKISSASTDSDLNDNNETELNLDDSEGNLSSNVVAKAMSRSGSSNLDSIVELPSEDPALLSVKQKRASFAAKSNPVKEQVFQKRTSNASRWKVIN